MSKTKRQPARKHKLLRAAGERKFQAHVNRKGKFPSLLARLLQSKWQRELSLTKQSMC